MDIVQQLLSVVTARKDIFIQT